MVRYIKISAKDFDELRKNAEKIGETEGGYTIRTADGRMVMHDTDNDDYLIVKES
jgi:hypothetical protein